MRIVVNDIAASRGGALTILESFHSYVRDADDGNEWVFLLGSDVIDESPTVRTVFLPQVKKSWMARLVFDLFTGRRIINSLRPDVVLSLQNTYTYGLSCPQVVYVHQPIPFQQMKVFSLRRRDERRLATYQHLIGAVIKQSIRRADHVIVQTRWVRDAIVDQVRIAGERVTVVPPGLDDLSEYHDYTEADPGEFFYPTADTAYKNNQCVEEACQLLDEKGITDFTVTMTIETSNAPHVNAIGRLPREEVLRRMSRSTLIFPSLIETYGLPLAEARALGSIVLAADLPYAREVLDGYANAYFFDPSSPHELAELMRRVMSGKFTESEAISEEEPANPTAQTYTWQRVVNILEDSTPRFGWQ